MVINRCFRVSTAEMFRMNGRQGPSGVVKSPPQAEKTSTSRTPSRASFVSDSEASGVENEVRGSDPLAAFYEEARVQKEEQAKFLDVEL
jgi:hypothetical protein